MAQANQAEISNFDSKVREKLRSYVYRLIDPRNGQTFYVSKGKGDCIFQHIKAARDRKVLQKFTQNKDGDFEETETFMKRSESPGSLSQKERTGRNMFWQSRRGLS